MVRWGLRGLQGSVVQGDRDLLDLPGNQGKRVHQGTAQWGPQAAKDPQGRMAFLGWRATLDPLVHLAFLEFPEEMVALEKKGLLEVLDVTDQKVSLGTVQQEVQELKATPAPGVPKVS